MKISQYPADATPNTSDYLIGDQASGPSTVRFLLSTLINLFWTLANIPSGATSPITRDAYTTLPYVATGMVWSGDAYNSTLLASMTTGVVFINGRFITIAAVAHRAFTASKDTYIDVLDNGDGTGTLVYTTATNNAASPALAANSIRIGIIVTGASSIAAAGSVNQGQETIVLPIASSIPYAVTDSLGNLICCRDPLNKLLGYRISTATFVLTSATAVQITGLSCPVIVPTGRKVRVSGEGNVFSTTTIAYLGISLWDGTVGSGTQLNEDALVNSTANAYTYNLKPDMVTTPSVASKTYNLGARRDTGTSSLASTSTTPSFIRVELE